jgi:hypothetical protein
MSRTKESQNKALVLEAFDTLFSLTEAQARAVIAPWYGLFNQPVQGDMKTLQEQILTADYESCWGYLPGECWGRMPRSQWSEGLPSPSPT